MIFMSYKHFSDHRSSVHNHVLWLTDHCDTMCHGLNEHFCSDQIVDRESQPKVGQLTGNMGYPQECHLLGFLFSHIRNREVFGNHHTSFLI